MGPAHRLALVPLLLPGGTKIVRPLARSLRRAFELEVERVEPTFDPHACYDATRGQHHSTRLLACLLADPATAGAARVLGVAGVDLFIPIFTYVFGEAQLDGRAAVVSTFRLDPRVYGLPADPALLRARLEKEAIHELGHTCGLLHCDGPRCVMHASTWVEDIDLKGARFCRRCAPALRTLPPGEGPHDLTREAASPLRPE